MSKFNELLAVISDQTKQINYLVEKVEHLTDVDEFINMDEASKLTKYSISTLRRYLKEIPHIQRDRTILFSKKDLIKWLNNSKKHPQ